VAQHQRLSARWIEESREHLQRRRLAGAVRAEEADDLAGLKLEGDLVHRAHLTVLPAEEALDGSTEPRVPLGDEERLVQAGDADGRLGHGDEPR